MRYLVLVMLMTASQLLATSLTTPRAVRVTDGCFTIHGKRICPPGIRQLVMNEDVFLLQGNKIVSDVQCQSHLHSQVPGHAIYCVGNPGGHQQIVPPPGNPGIGGQHPNPVSGVPGVGKIVVP